MRVCTCAVPPYACLNVCRSLHWEQAERPQLPNRETSYCGGGGEEGGGVKNFPITSPSMTAGRAAAIFSHNPTTTINHGPSPGLVYQPHFQVVVSTGSSIIRDTRRMLQHIYQWMHLYYLHFSSWPFSACKINWRSARQECMYRMYNYSILCTLYVRYIL